MKKTITIIICFILGMTALGTLRLIARNNFDIINLIPIVLKSTLAGITLLSITYFFLLRKLLEKKATPIIKNMNPEEYFEIAEIAWISLNFLALYFLISMTLAGDFHFYLKNEAEKIFLAIVGSLFITFLSKLRRKKK